MIKFLLPIFTLITLSYGATAQNVNIPDAIFKNVLVQNTNINTNMDSEIQTSEAHAFTGAINCQNMNISDLTGIEAFTSLTELKCYGNNLTNLDVSQNTALTILYCGNNPLGSIDVSQNIALERLQTNNNNLSSLDVSQNTTLFNLVCPDNNLTSLDISQNTNLYLLSVADNNLTSLDVSQNVNLGVLQCINNNLTTLDLSQNTAFSNLQCANNDLSELNLKNISTSNLANFNATSNPNLTCIEVDDVAAATAAWTNIDASASFSTSCSPIVNIPDANFKTYLVGNSSINTNMDSEIQVNEAEAFSGAIDCQAQSISDLTGIEAFTALTGLYLGYNTFSTVDVSQNTALTTLHCGNNNNLSSINISQNTALTDLNTKNCPSLNTLDVSQNPALTSLVVEQNNLTTLDVSQNTVLEYLECQDNSLSALNLSQNAALEYLSCGENSLSTLDVSQNTALVYVSCEKNSIGSLDLSQNTALTNLIARYNNINTLDLNQNIALTHVHVTNNLLTSLNVSQNTALTKLIVSFNDLGSLDVSQNTALIDLYCRANNLSTLDVSQNTALYEFHCQENNLTVLKMKNISTNILTDFEADSNPNLTCIEVDDAAAATAAWTNIDPQTSFSEDCGYTIPVTSISVQGQGGATSISTLGGTLQMEAEVFPMNATDNTYTWSVINLTGSATIDANGLLTALTDGTVKVGVTANDGSGVTGSADITISNQSSSIGELNTIPSISIFPNPTNAQIVIDSKANIQAVSILNVMGKTVRTIVQPNSTIDVSDLAKGIYFLELQIDNTFVSKKIIKE